MSNQTPIDFKGRKYWLFEKEEQAFQEWIDSPAGQMHLRSGPGHHTFVQLSDRQFRVWNHPTYGWTIEPCIYR